MMARLGKVLAILQCYIRRTRPGRSVVTPGRDMPMSLREQLRRAKPTVDSPTYRRLTGTMSEEAYQKAMREERARLGLPEQKRQAASS